MHDFVRYFGWVEYQWFVLDYLSWSLAVFLENLIFFKYCKLTVEGHFGSVVFKHFSIYVYLFLPKHRISTNTLSFNRLASLVVWVFDLIKFECLYFCLIAVVHFPAFYQMVCAMPFKADSLSNMSAYMDQCVMHLHCLHTFRYNSAVLLKWLSDRKFQNSMCE